MTPQELADEVTARPKGHRSMSADQLRRAAERAPHYAADPVRRDLAVAALLATAAGHWSLAHSVLTDCRLHEGDCLVCMLDDVAAAYLGEEPQP